MQHASNTAWDSKIPVTWQSIVAHFFLIQNLHPATMFNINGPLWSVALEWQIYFGMAIVLLPLWRRIRPGWIVGAFLAITLVPAVIQTGSYLHPWLVALFTAGMWSAQLTLSVQRRRWAGPLAIVFACCIPPAAILADAMRVPEDGFVECLSGLAVACALVWAGQRSLSGRTPAIVRPLQSRPMMFVGLISYSIYLFHSPLLGLFNLLALPMELPVVTEYLLLTVIGIPITVGIAYLMFWLVERHFLNTRQRHATGEMDECVAHPERASR